jgi:hypothetical protein
MGSGALGISGLQPVRRLAAQRLLVRRIRKVGNAANRCDVTHSHDQMKAEQAVWVFGGKRWGERRRISSARRSGKVVRKWCAAGMQKPRTLLCLGVCAPPGTRTPNPLISTGGCSWVAVGNQNFLQVTDPVVTMDSSFLLDTRRFALIEVRKEVRRSRQLPSRSRCGPPPRSGSVDPMSRCSSARRVLGR